MYLYGVKFVCFFNNYWETTQRARRQGQPAQQAVWFTNLFFRVGSSIGSLIVVVIGLPMSMRR